MSLPDQEAHSLRLAWEFLLDLSSGREKRIPSATRKRARQVAKHYPLAAEELWFEVHERTQIADRAFADLAAAHVAGQKALLNARHRLALLIEAINKHQRACERMVRQSSWARANDELYRVGLLAEQAAEDALSEVDEMIGWSIGQTAERLGISVEQVRRLIQAEVLERSEFTGLVTEASIRQLEASRERPAEPTDEHS